LFSVGHVAWGQVEDVVRHEENHMIMVGLGLRNVSDLSDQLNLISRLIIRNRQRKGKPALVALNIEMTNGEESLFDVIQNAFETWKSEQAS